MAEEDHAAQLQSYVQRFKERAAGAGKQPRAGAGSGQQEQDAQSNSEPQQLDFFELDIPLLELAFKDDMESMEAPIYSLATKPDTEVFKWESADGKRKMTISPNAELGRATIFDKDVLIYCTSQIVAALNAGLSPSKRVRFVVTDYFRGTLRTSGGSDYERFFASMNRLRGTNIVIQEEGESQRRARGFGLIDSWEIIDSQETGKKRMVRVECTLSDWLFDAIADRKILTISPQYFELRKPLERRLYEIARKHCGKQSEWKIGLALLKEKCGSQSELKRFRFELRKIADVQSLPDYMIRLTAEDDMVHFIPRVGSLGS